MTATIVLALVLVAAVLPAAVHLLQHADPAAAWAQIPAGKHAVVELLAGALAGLGAFCLASFSVFVRLKMSSPSLMIWMSVMLAPAGL